LTRALVGVYALPRTTRAQFYLAAQIWYDDGLRCHQLSAISCHNSGRDGGSVDLGDAGRALRAAATVDTTGLSAERRARMLIDVARAHAQRRQVPEAAAALREAEEITPEQVHSHDMVRQLVSDLLTMQDPPATELRELSVRLGVTKGRDS
jgi:hypothetical protein